MAGETCTRRQRPTAFVCRFDSSSSSGQIQHTQQAAISFEGKRWSLFACCQWCHCCYRPRIHTRVQVKGWTEFKAGCGWRIIHTYKILPTNAGSTAMSHHKNSRQLMCVWSTPQPDATKCLEEPPIGAAVESLTGGNAQQQASCVVNGMLVDVDFFFLTRNQHKNRPREHNKP